MHRVLDEYNVRHALCGGLAANLYREQPRATDDVDFYVIVAPTQLVDVTRAFEANGWAAHPYWRQGQLLRLDHPNFVRTDCLIAATELERSAIDDAVGADVQGTEVPVLRPESLIVFKLVAGRFQDYDAAAAIYNAYGDRLDESYIEDALETIDMSDRWERAKEGAVRQAEDRG